MPEPILEWWMETPTFLFDGKKTFINTKEIPGHEHT